MDPIDFPGLCILFALGSLGICVVIAGIVKE